MSANWHRIDEAPKGIGPLLLRAPKARGRRRGADGGSRHHRWH